MCLKPWALLFQGVIYIVVGGGYFGWSAFELEPSVFGQNVVLFVQCLDLAGFAFLDNTVVGCDCVALLW